MKRILLIAILAVAAWTSFARAAAPDSVFDLYMHAALAGNWDDAKTQWLPEELALSQRLGISYIGVPLKIDCSSPLLEHRAAINSGVVAIKITEPFRDDERMVVKRVTLRTKSGDSVTATYPVVPRDGRWYVTSRLWWETKSWRSRESRYLRLQTLDTTLVNDYALAQADRFVDSLLTLFHATPEQRTLLANQKILYFLGDKGSVQTLSDFDVHGVGYRPLDAIITSHLPHEHELTHVVADFVMSPLPMYTTPVLQEGLAVACGGRWGKSPRVVLNLGAYILQNQLIGLNEILDERSFRDGATSDLTYAAAGVLTRYLLESLGWARFASLYRRLSGPQQYVSGLGAGEVERVISETTSQPWDALSRACLAGANEQAERDAGIRPAPDAPPSEPVVFESASDSLSVRLFAIDDGLYLESSGPSAHGQHGLILIDKSPRSQAGYRSTMFAEQWPGVEYEGQPVGIVLDDSEAGIYDYRTNTLLAKFASGFSNGQSFWDQSATRNRVRIDAGILPVVVDSVSFQVLCR